MFTPTAIDFCSRCGHRTHLALPDDGDTRQRAICTHCGFIHYQNPLNVVAPSPSQTMAAFCCANATSSHAGAPGHCPQGLWS